jgi:hypothetical protein
LTIQTSIIAGFEYDDTGYHTAGKYFYMRDSILLSIAKGRRSYTGLRVACSRFSGVDFESNYAFYSAGRI